VPLSVSDTWFVGQGYDYTEPQPAGLRVKMFQYQLSTYQWLLDHERDPGGLNSYFWEAWEWQDGNLDEGDALFYFPVSLKHIPSAGNSFEA
jgi:hypothetical protein